VTIDDTHPAARAVQERILRAGGEVSERQWRDVIGLLRAHRDDLDDACVEHWARHIRVDDLLARARSDAVG